MTLDSIVYINVWAIDTLQRDSDTGRPKVSETSFYGTFYDPNSLENGPGLEELQGSKYSCHNPEDLAGVIEESLLADGLNSLTKLKKQDLRIEVISDYKAGTDSADGCISSGEVQVIRNLTQDELAQTLLNLNEQLQFYLNY